MAGTKANLISGPGVLYIGPVGEALPEIDNLTPPAITITVAGNWVDMGFSMDNHKLLTEQEFEEGYVLEHLGPVVAPPTKERAVFMVKFAERDLGAFNDGTFTRTTLSTIAAGADQTAQDLLGFGDKVATTQKSLMYVAESPEGGSRVLHMYIAQAIENQEILHNLQLEGFDAAFLLLADPTQSAGETIYKWYDITAVATA